jgi:hypothetical protein
MPVSITNTDLGVRVANEVPRKKNQPKHSGFFLTINTNYHPKGKEENGQECAEKLREAMKEMLGNEENLKKIVTFLNEGDTWNDETIEKVDSQFVVERGRSPRGGRIHAHAALHIDHHSKIRLNIPAIKDVILPYFNSGCTGGIKNLYVNVRIINTNVGIRNYLTKENLA